MAQRKLLCGKTGSLSGWHQWLQTQVQRCPLLIANRVRSLLGYPYNWDILISCNVGTNIVSVESAVSLSHLIRIITFSVVSIVSHHVFKSIVHNTSLTTVVTKGAGTIDEVLLTEGDQLSFLQIMLIVLLESQ